MILNQLVGCYLPSTPQGLEELYLVAVQNVKNQLITKIYVILEDEGIQNSQWPEATAIRKLWENPKVEVVKTFKRYTYADYFNFANQRATGIWMLSNCDVSYDGTLALLEKIDFSKVAICLSKIEVLNPQGDLFHLTDEMKGYSQDTWIFKPPIKVANGDFFMGVQRCDNRIAWEFNNVGLRPFNPAGSINSFHYHLARKRTYRQDLDCVPGPILFVSAPYHL